MKLYGNLIKKNFKEHQKVLIKSLSVLENKILFAAEIISNSLKNKNLVMWCGNGGSASDSLHLSAELIGRFKKNRKPLNSISLAGNSSTLTCISNDFGYKNLFSRQVKALGKKGDTLIVISTSGNSDNIFRALIEAKKIGVKTIALLGNNGGKCKGLSNVDLVVPSKSIARTQEMHIMIGHIICELIERKLNLLK